jgi:hypothetical protein
MRQDIADRISELMMEYQAKLNASTLLVQATCTEEEFQSYRRAVGRATDFMFIEISRALEGRPSMEMNAMGEMSAISDRGSMSDMSDMSDIIDLEDEIEEMTARRERPEQEVSSH